MPSVARRLCDRWRARSERERALEPIDLVVDGDGMRARIGWLLALGIATSCSRAGDLGPPSAPQRDTATLPEALADAVARWHDDDDIEPLARYVAAHPDAELGVWREVVALHRYDACGSSTDVHGLRTVAHEFPDTIAGRLARVTLLGDGLGRLKSETVGPLVVDFLDGGDAWTRDAEGARQVSVTEIDATRREQEPVLRARFAAALVDDGCTNTMGYCTWWVARFPAEPQTQAIAEAAKKTWYRRGHPHWEGGEHARCSLRCAKRCREAAKPLDDSCYAPCYARCP